MWECSHCGQGAITSDVPFCPQCYAPRDTPAEPAEPVAADSVAPPPDDKSKGKKLCPGSLSQARRTTGRKEKSHQLVPAPRHPKASPTGVALLLGQTASRLSPMRRAAPKRTNQPGGNPLLQVGRVPVPKGLPPPQRASRTLRRSQRQRSQLLRAGDLAPKGAVEASEREPARGGFLV